jgi:alkylhydroperoxidase family enzyme
VSSINELLAPRPDLQSGVETFMGRLWRDRLVDPVMLELCRVRVAQLLGDPVGTSERTPGIDVDPALLSVVAGWPRDSRFSELERAALEVAELFVIDPHNVTDQHMATLAEFLDEAAVVAFITALGLFDGFTRLRLAVGADA